MARFAERLKALRVGAALTQQELADRAGLHRVAVTRLETGEREPVWATVQALAAALGVEVTEFVEPSVARKKGKR